MGVASIDFCDVLAARLREAGYEDARVRRLENVSRGGIAVRRMPSTTAGEYYGGGRSVSYVAQVVVARESEARAIDECCAIAGMLRDLDLRSANGSYGLSAARVYTEPQELYQGAVTAWEFRVQADITVR